MVPVGWCDVEVSPERPPRQEAPGENFFFPVQGGFYHHHQYHHHAMPTNLMATFQQGDDDDDDSSDSSDSQTSPFQDYLQGLVMRVEGRLENGGNDNSAGPFTAAEIAELSLRAGRGDDAFGGVDSDTLKRIAEWLYEHVWKVTAVSILDEAGRAFTKDAAAAPSQSMAALHQVRKQDYPSIHPFVLV